MNNIKEELNQIIKENSHRISVAGVMQIIDEISDLVCEEFSDALGVHYEEIEDKLFNAKRKIKEKLDEEKT